MVYRTGVMRYMCTLDPLVRGIACCAYGVVGRCSYHLYSTIPPKQLYHDLAVSGGCDGGEVAIFDCICTEYRETRDERLCGSRNVRSINCAAFSVFCVDCVFRPGLTVEVLFEGRLWREHDRTSGFYFARSRAFSQPTPAQ